MKKRNTYIIFTVLTIITVLIIYGTYNLKEDKKSVSKIIRMTGDATGPIIIDEMEKIEHLSNPIAKIYYYFYKKKFYARFVDQDEQIKLKSENKIINDISNFYRSYWVAEFMKKNPTDRTDTILYKNLSNYLINNHLTDVNYNSLYSNIKNDIELTKVIEKEGMYCEFFFLNGFQDIVIWDKQSEDENRIELPNDTLDITVVFIENYLLKGRREYLTFGKSQIGGWTSSSKSKLFCNKGSYDLDSEKYLISYLKHEANHFIDKIKYPTLSSADLEYRSKLVELIYCDKTTYDRIEGFVLGASPDNRNYSHPYSNYTIIKNLSQILFNNDFESDMIKWNAISSKEINQAAEKLFLDNSEELSKIKNPTKII